MSRKLVLHSNEDTNEEVYMFAGLNEIHATGPMASFELSIGNEKHGHSDNANPYTFSFYPSQGGVLYVNDKQVKFDGRVNVMFYGDWESYDFAWCMQQISTRILPGDQCANQESTQPEQPDIQQLTYRVFELIEPAIKQAIAQAIQEHFES